MYIKSWNYYQFNGHNIKHPALSLTSGKSNLIVSFSVCLCVRTIPKMLTDKLTRMIYITNVVANSIKAIPRRVGGNDATEMKRKIPELYLVWHRQTLFEFGCVHTYVWDFPFLPFDRYYRLSSLIFVFWNIQFGRFV